MVRYYKKITVEKAWTQPIATTYNGSDVNSAFGVLGGDSFAVLGDSYWDTRTYLWQAFDGQVTPTNTAYWQTGAGGNHWVKWYNPIALKVSSIKIYNISATSYNVAGGSIYGSDDGVNWELLRTFTGNQTASAVQNIIVSANHKYGKIEFTNTSQLSISELRINATTVEHKWQECNKSEYDQLSNDNRKIVTDIFSAFVKNKLCKKGAEVMNFTQPILSSAGTLGGNSFAVALYATTVAGHLTNISTCFNGQTDTNNVSNTNGIYVPASCEIVIYNPIPLNIKKFILSQGAPNANGGLHAGTIYGSDNGINWVKIATYSNLTANASTITEYINLPNTGYYKYYKIANTTGGTHGVVVKEITITATQKVEKWVECTKVEYDQLSADKKCIKNVYLTPKIKNINYMANVA